MPGSQRCCRVLSERDAARSRRIRSRRLTPNLGVLDMSAFDVTDDRRVTVADMPGLIEGASGGAGLGHEFLRHVARTRILIHVVDMAAADPERDYQVIRGELEEYEPDLIEKVTLVVANKMDLPDARENLKSFERARARDELEVVAISAEEKTGIDELVAALAELLPSADELAQPAESAGVVVHRFESGPDAFSVQREGEALSRASAGALNASRRRRTSTTRNPPSGSSATWPSLESSVSFSARA